MEIIEFIRGDSDLQTSLEKVFIRLSEEGKEIKYPSHKEILDNIVDIDIENLLTHKALNSKLSGFMYEAVMSKVIVALGKYVEYYTDSARDVITSGDPIMATGTLKSLFEILEKYQKVSESFYMANPDKILKPGEKIKIDRNKIDQLRSEL